MRKKVITIFVILLIIGMVGTVYVSFFSDFALPGQGCGSEFSILPHANKSCIFPFSCKRLSQDIVGGVCSL